MAKTYLDLVNVVLRDINEVPLTETNFGAARGLQAFVKEAINRALMDIVNYSDEWPWLTNVPLTSASPSTDTFTTVAGQREYLITRQETDGEGNLVDVAIDNIDWDTFLFVDVDSASRVFPLPYTDYDFVAKSLPVSDDKPEFVYRPLNNTHIGVYPTPDKEYPISYISWKPPVLLSETTDEIPFDERWYTVVVSRSRYYAWMFRENIQQAQVANNEYERNVKRMFLKYMLPNYDGMRAV